MESLKLKIKTSTRNERTEEDAATAALPAGPPKLALDDVVAAENVLWFFNSALNLLNYTTYFEMERARARSVRRRRAFLDRLPPSIEAIHLIGHSLARGSLRAAANSTTPHSKHDLAASGLFA